MATPRVATLGPYSSRPRSLRARLRERFQAAQRDVQNRDQSRQIVFECKLAVMQMGDGADQREAEPSTAFRPARVEPSEAPQRFLAALFGDARSMIGDGDREAFPILADGDLDGSTRSAVADRIFDQIADRLGD